MPHEAVGGQASITCRPRPEPQLCHPELLHLSDPPLLPLQWHCDDSTCLKVVRFMEKGRCVKYLFGMELSFGKCQFSSLRPTIFIFTHLLTASLCRSLGWEVLSSPSWRSLSRGLVECGRKDVGIKWPREGGPSALLCVTLGKSFPGQSSWGIGMLDDSTVSVVLGPWRS